MVRCSLHFLGASFEAGQRLRITGERCPTDTLDSITSSRAITGVLGGPVLAHPVHAFVRRRGVGRDPGVVAYDLDRSKNAQGSGKTTDSVVVDVAVVVKVDVNPNRGRSGSNPRCCGRIMTPFRGVGTVATCQPLRHSAGLSTIRTREIDQWQRR